MPPLIPYTNLSSLNRHDPLRSPLSGALQRLRVALSVLPHLRRSRADGRLLPLLRIACPSGTLIQWERQRPKDCHLSKPNQSNPMTFDLATALLNRANTGADLLEILDSIAADQEGDQDA